MIAQKLEINSEVELAGNKLDQYYISARYPDAFSAGVPFQFYKKDQATEAIQLAATIVQKVIDELGNR